jgi:rod shape-determining protein MreD
MYLLLALSLVLQLTAVDFIKIFDAKVDLMLLLVIFFGLFFGGSAGLEAGFAAGLCKDILSLGTFGINTLVLSVTGLVVGILSPKFFKESRMSQAFLVFAFAIFSMLFHYMADLFVLKITYIRASEYMWALIIPSSLYTAIVSIIIFPLLIHKYHLEEREEFL